MHGASAVAQRPGRLERVFLNTELSSNGIYGLQLYVLGVPTTVTIDDRMPLDASGRLVFGGISKDQALWGALVEKAFAKLHGTYENIISGDARHSIEVLSGAHATRYPHRGHAANADKAVTDTFAAQAVFDAILAHSDDWSMISAHTDGAGGASNQEQTALGLARDHVYTVLGAWEVGGERLLRIRTPWGRERYTGPWADRDSANWDRTLQGQADTFAERFPELHAEEDDGVFFIDYLSYHAEFYLTQIHLDTTDMAQDYFLVTDDTSTLPADGPYCEAGCERTKHTFTLRSEATQTVYLSAHTWPERTYPEGCDIGAVTGPVQDRDYHML